MKKSYHKLLLNIADILKNLGQKLYLYVSKKYLPKYDRGFVPISQKEYMGNKKMFKKIGYSNNWYEHNG